MNKVKSAQTKNSTSSQNSQSQRETNAKILIKSCPICHMLLCEKNYFIHSYNSTVLLDENQLLHFYNSNINHNSTIFKNEFTFCHLFMAVHNIKKNTKIIFNQENNTYKLGEHEGKDCIGSRDEYHKHDFSLQKRSNKLKEKIDTEKVRIEKKR